MEANCAEKLNNYDSYHLILYILPKMNKMITLKKHQNNSTAESTKCNKTLVLKNGLN